MEPQWRLAGVDQVNRMLAQLGPVVADRVGIVALRAAARVGAEAVRKAAPRGMEPLNKKQKRYGRLADNIRTSTVKSRGQELAVVVHTGRAFWGHMLEFGTKRMAPRPWFTGAFDGAQEAMLDTLTTALARGVGREATRLSRRRDVRL